MQHTARSSLGGDVFRWPSGRTPLSAASPCLRSLSLKPTMHLQAERGPTCSQRLASAQLAPRRRPRVGGWWSLRGGPLGHLVGEHIDATAPRNGDHCQVAPGESGTPGTSQVWAELLAPRFCGPSLHRPCRSPHRYRCTTLVIRVCTDLRAPVVAVTVAPRALRLWATLLGATARGACRCSPLLWMLGGSAGLVYGLPVGGVAGQVCCCVPRAQRAPEKALTYARCCRGLSILLPAKRAVGFGSLWGGHQRTNFSYCSSLSLPGHIAERGRAHRARRHA